MRAAEVAGRTADRIDFLAREVRVDRQWHGKLDEFAPVTYSSSNRTIPASDRVLDELACRNPDDLLRTPEAESVL